MKMPDELAGNVQRAALFFQRPEWVRILEAIYATYLANGAARGQAVLRAATFEEKQAVARFLRKRLPGQFYEKDNLEVRLADFQKALDASGFACELGDLLRALYPARSHITRPMQRQNRREAQQAFLASLTALAHELAGESRGKRWLLTGQHGQEALFRQYKNDTPENQRRLLHGVRLVMEALDQLPEPPHFERLALFAQRVSGDPHCLDMNTFTGRLFLQALTDLSSPREDGATNAEMQDAREEEVWRHLLGAEQEQQRLLLYAEAGLLLDTISSTVAVFHLASARDRAGRNDPWIEQAGERILLLPLRQVLAWQAVSPATTQVYLFENPQVFEVVVDTLCEGNRREAGHARALPTLVCTSGWPSAASMLLLRKLGQASSNVTFHYSGDFDLQGLRIAAHLLARYPHRCRLWRFDPVSYDAALHASAADLEVHEKDRLDLLPDLLSPLSTAMREKGKKAYQEGIVALLIEDIQKSGDTGSK